MEDEVLVAWNKRSARKPQQTPKVPSYVGEVIAVTSHIQTYAQNEIEKLLATALEEQRATFVDEVKNRKATIKWLWGKQKTDDECFLMVMEQVQKIADILNGKE